MSGKRTRSAAPSTSNTQTSSNTSGRKRKRADDSGVVSSTSTGKLTFKSTAATGKKGNVQMCVYILHINIVLWATHDAN